MQIRRHTELSEFVLPKQLLNNSADRINMVTDCQKLDSDIELGLIIVLQRNTVHEFGEITKNNGHYAVQAH